MRAIARAVMVSVVLVLLSFVAFSFWSGTAWDRYSRLSTPRAVGTSGIFDRTRETLDDAALSSKIKAKMMLDDAVRARSINVTTHGSVVTLSGQVDSVDEHDRAVRLARETHGVTEVVDRVGVRVREP
jgi:osmotically-inducible protein OsmY